MTQEREEMLIATMGKVDRFIDEWDTQKGSLASHTDMEKVEKKIDAHIENHRWGFGQAVAVIFGAGGLITGITAIFVRPK